MVKEIKNQQPIHKRNSRSSSPKKPTNKYRRNSVDNNPSNIPNSHTNTYYTTPPINRNRNDQNSYYESDNYKNLIQQSVSSSQQENFYPLNEVTEDIDIHTVTAESETTDQPPFKLSNLIPTSWGVYPKSGQ
ncbi:hypothetical protein RclHR1_19890002 [Rhizophagus clarus]|uniref:Uncharacterized protein n=1 Tax=Rhizophagus clarus TaxID=94130 RepID=A0A2Z6QRY2_9GLOM|nr:hypothetical protein RclHR1_19890002 [Rhizophagus clarus]GES74520.1 hypothetical protein RCL_jg10105.t1 [Rhizophagus clarus]